MITKGSVRRKSRELFEKVISLRKSGHSYGEIVKETGLAKSTINNWITHAGLNLSKEHLQIQAIKRVENHVIGTEASRVTRAKRKEEDIQKFIESVKKHFDDPLFNYGIALFESEGSKSVDCKFSNSDYKLIETFIRFIEKYLSLDRHKNISYSLYIHESRVDDLEKICSFWAGKIGINKKIIKVYWKKNKVVGRRENPDYVGQFSIRVMGIPILGSKLLTVSSIILSRYLR